MKKNPTTSKQILNGCTPCLFSKRQEYQSFDKALLGQNKEIIKANNDRIGIYLGANSFL